ncbi:MAG: 5'-nucleotidase, lipoprotein e(P4) family [Bacteroidales bacterium]|nr:5'-nucleotidase, lipoprotein e(P4) family [Bacteroidales bacterium]MCF8397960.1 5'-nucleotidase, lipoprotein e(P4) family [Bacteroidales bacterium]
MKLIRISFISMAALLIYSCSMKVDDSSGNLSIISENEALLMATLYQQTAAEKEALAYQAYNWARKVIQNDMKRMGLSKKQAVVVDIDETIIDNSPYEASCILDEIAYPERWDEWIESASGKPLPGAVDFLNYAAENGYDVYYITNRKEKYRAATLENLRKFNFPFAKDAHLLMRTDERSKVNRRAKVSEDHRIVLLMGDNLSDFAGIFDHKTVEERLALTEKNKDKFGFEYIALPNAMYGAWLQALYNYEDALSFEEKRTLMLKHLKGF